jgi:protein TonB
MFEDSTFESTGRIQTGSRNWMAATFLLNSTILTAMIVIPLLFPRALPRMANSFLMSMPTLQVDQPKPLVRLPNAAVVTHQINLGQFTAPTTIPKQIYYAERPEVATPINAASAEMGNVAPLALPGMPEYHHPRVVSDATKTPVRVSSRIVEGMIVQKTVPIYPPIAHAAGVEGTVVLGALIARDGTIQNLHIVSGSAMLQQAAVDAVRTWRYRPYLLNGDPVEVETTINVIFKLH